MGNLSNLFGSGNNGSVSYTGWFSENDVAIDQTPSTTDAGQMYRFTSSTSADRTLTLPSVDAASDGIIFWIANESAYTITITPNDSSSVWNSGNGYGIELPEKVVICLRYNHSNTTWEIVNKSGGMVKLEGLKLHVPCDFQGTYQPGANTGLLSDLVGRHRVKTFNQAYIESSSNFVGVL